MNKLKKEAPEVPAQEQLIKDIIQFQLNKFRKIQCILFFIQTIIIIIFSIMLINEKKYVSELLNELSILKNLLSNF